MWVVGRPEVTRQQRVVGGSLLPCGMREQPAHECTVEQHQGINLPGATKQSTEAPNLPWFVSPAPAG